MKFKQFKIKNFKGIEDITINLNKSPNSDIFTLVGLNESGKTTILEALNFFNRNETGLEALGLPGSVIENYNDLIPISNRDNFNDSIYLEATLIIEDKDIEKVNQYAKEHTDFKYIEPKKEIGYYRSYIFENSKFKKTDFRWDGFNGIHKDNNIIENISGEEYPKDNLKLASFCRNLIPSVLYFPNFLFDFPSRIYLESSEALSSKEVFYINLIQDILDSLNNDTNIDIHLISRIKSEDKKNLSRLVQLMGKKVTEVIFNAWKNIFKRNLDNTRILINYGKDKKNLSYLEFEIESDDGIYLINERSLGFRWFFIFLLFTQFRPFRKNDTQNVIFLFDEPASNLHSIAQKQLLSSFNNLTSNSKIIYTTHSHHMINPKWLESTYVVKNEGLDLNALDEYTIKKTKITIESYREFAAKHPYNTAYFQPILDVLDYSPSDLESLPNCVFLEGKNDFYTLKYFQDVILKSADKVNLAPSTGSGNLETLISLYIGWGKEFLILLDSDKSGKLQKKRYIEEFGLIVEERIYTFEDIDSSWNKAIESLIEEQKLDFQKTCYPSSSKYNKTHFNRSIQENLAKNKPYNFNKESITNFEKIFSFLKKSMINKTI